jgi:hypothetical protein
LPDRILYADLVKKIQDNTITKLEMSKYFELDALATKPYRPTFKLNYGSVDVDGVEPAAQASAHALALDAQRAVQENVLGRLERDTSLLKLDAQYRIIAEGDSWFSHPLNTTVIDVLQNSGYAIHNMAQAGRTLEEMVTKAEYVPDLKRGGIRYFLFSGGGNDFLGDESEACVKLYDHFHAQPGDAPYYIKDEFFKQMRQVSDNYAELLSQIAKSSPSTSLLVDGYAYARPSVGGLGHQFEYLGFDLAVHEDLTDGRLL